MPRAVHAIRLTNPIGRRFFPTRERRQFFEVGGQGGGIAPVLVA